MAVASWMMETSTSGNVALEEIYLAIVDKIYQTLALRYSKDNIEELKQLKKEFETYIGSHVRYAASLELIAKKYDKQSFKKVEIDNTRSKFKVTRTMKPKVIHLQSSESTSQATTDAYEALLSLSSDKRYPEKYQQPEISRQKAPTSPNPRTFLANHVSGVSSTNDIQEGNYLSQCERSALKLTDEDGNAVLPNNLVIKLKRGSQGFEYYLVNQDSTQTRVRTPEAWNSHFSRERLKLLAGLSNSSLASVPASRACIKKSTYIGFNECKLLKLKDRNGKEVLPDDLVIKKEGGAGYLRYYLVDKQECKLIRLSKTPVMICQPHRKKVKQQVDISTPPLFSVAASISSIEQSTYLTQAELENLNLMDENNKKVLPSDLVLKRGRGEVGSEYHLVNKDGTQTRVRTPTSWRSHGGREKLKRQINIGSILLTSPFVPSDSHSSPTQLPVEKTTAQTFASVAQPKYLSKQVLHSLDLRDINDKPVSADARVVMEQGIYFLIKDTCGKIPVYTRDMLYKCHLTLMQNPFFTSRIHRMFSHQNFVPQQVNQANLFSSQIPPDSEP